MIRLPGKWALVSINAPHLPYIRTDVGSTGEHEFAFTNISESRAEFSVIVRYPASAASAVASSTALIRASRKLAAIAPAPVQLRCVDTGGERKPCN